MQLVIFLKTQDEKLFRNVKTTKIYSEYCNWGHQNVNTKSQKTVNNHTYFNTIVENTFNI